MCCWSGARHCGSSVLLPPQEDSCRGCRKTYGCCCAARTKLSSTRVCHPAALLPHRREYAAGLSFSAGPLSYLALRLSASGGPPSLLWSSAPAQRDRLPLGLTEASPAVPPAVSAKDGLFYYWSATAPPAQSPLGAPVEPQWTPEATAAGAAAGAPSPAAQRRLLAEGSASGAAPSPAPGASNATGPAPSASPAATAAAVDAASAAAAAQAAAQAVLAAAVPMQTQGLGVVAPEGVLPTPV